MRVHQRLARCARRHRYGAKTQIVWAVAVDKPVEIPQNRGSWLCESQTVVVVTRYFLRTYYV